MSEEEGRLRVAMLEAETASRIAELVADAKGQYPAAVGRAFASLSGQPEVLTAYNDLYALSVIRPHRTIAFHGFGEDDLKAAEALLVAPGATGAAPLPNPMPPLAGDGERRMR